MIKYIGKTHTLIEAEEGKYLILAGTENAEQLKIGKPVRIIFDNSAEIPEFEERHI